MDLWYIKSMNFNGHIDLGFKYDNVHTEFYSQHFRIYDPIRNSYVPFELTNQQIELISNYDTYNNNVVKKYRQAGATLLTSAWIAKKIMEGTEHVLIVTNRADMSEHILDNIKTFVRQINEDVFNHNTKRYFSLRNGSTVKGISSLFDSNSYSPTILYVDEAAYINYEANYLMATTRPNSKIIVVSTPNGYDRFFYPLYNNAVEGTNLFHPTNLEWYDNPRYNVNFHEETGTSPWYENQRRHTNERQFRQEVLGEFIN